jgi:ATP-dependent Clp protease ATP-binding subunit ClpC
MFYERFTHKARRAVILAKREAFYSPAKLVGPEHILIGILREDTGIGARALKKTEMNLAKSRIFVRTLPPLKEQTKCSDQAWLSQESKFLYDRAWHEAQRLGHTYIGTEHLLLAIVHNSRVGQVLRAQAISGPAIRKQLLLFLGHGRFAGKSE